jgi:superfamily I DNA/RNA helicase
MNRWKTADTIDKLIHRLEEYRETEVQKFMAKGKEMRAENIADTVDTLLTILFSMPQGSTIFNAQKKVNDMFYDSETSKYRKTLTLSTIHKSKGREWNKVYWYGKNKLQPSKYARQEWQVEQENNLMYVACTRSKGTLTIVDVPSPKGFRQDSKVPAPVM